MNKLQAAEAAGFFFKLAEVDVAQMQKTIARLQKLEEDPPEPKQLARYATLGAAIAPVTSVLGDIAEGESPFRHNPDGTRNLGRSARRFAGKAVTGAITSGLIPILRHSMDRRAEIGELRDQLQQAGVKTATSLIPNAESTPRARLAASQRIGLPRITNLEGPSLAQVSRTMGKVLPGSAKGTL